CFTTLLRLIFDAYLQKTVVLSRSFFCFAHFFRRMDFQINVYAFPQPRCISGGQKRKYNTIKECHSLMAFLSPHHRGQGNSSKSCQCHNGICTQKCELGRSLVCRQNGGTPQNDCLSP